MVNLNLPVPGVTKGIADAPPGQDWATLNNAALTALNAAKVEAVIVVTGSEPRPATAAVVFWIGGTVQPTGMVDGDVWGGVTLTAPVITTASVNGMSTTVAFSQTLAATGTAPITWAVTVGALPAGIALSTAGVLSGTPTTAAAYSFTVTATNAVGSNSKAFSGTVSAGAALLPAASLTESNTGYQPSMGALTTRGGGSITTAGTVIDRANVTEPIYVNAPNVIIRRSQFAGGYWCLEIGPNATNLLVEDCTLIGGDNCAVMDDGYAANVTYRRLNIRGSEDGMKLSGIGRKLENIYIHDLVPRPGNTDPHHDSIQCYSGSEWVFDSCKLESPDTSNIAMFNGQGGWHNVTIRNNLFGGPNPGPAYAIYAPGTPQSGSLATGIKVLDNVFGAWLYGPVTDWWSAGAGNEWSGNTRAGTGVTVTP